MINRLLNISFLVVCLWATGPCSAWADKIYFNSGRKMEARVLSDEDGKLELALPNGGTMTIDRDTVSRIQKADPSEINVNFADGGPNTMLVDVTINEATKATMLVDTGASICLLSNKLGKELGIDTSDPHYQVKVQVADGGSVPAFYTKLPTLRLQHIVAKNVEAAVLLQDLPPKVSFKDGLLGMSFLGRYKTHVDYAAKKFIVEE